jgi:transcriptional regulator with XRE-family HTH domain
MAERFDTEGFFSALNTVRARRELSWREVASQSGVAPSTLSRLSQGKNPDVNGLAALLGWSGLKAEMFIPSVEVESADPIAQITSLIRRDRRLARNSARIMEDLVTRAYRSLTKSETEKK